jgi:hypothetical protein
MLPAAAGNRAASARSERASRLRRLSFSGDNMSKHFQRTVRLLGVIVCGLCTGAFASETACAAPADSPEKVIAAREQEIEAQLKHVQSQIAMVQNELDQQVVAAESELARDLGRAYLNVYSRWSGQQMQIEELLKAKLEITRSIAGVNVDLKELDQARKEGGKSADFEKEIRGDARCVGLRQRLDTLEIKLELAQATTAPNQSAITELKLERDAVKHKLDSAADELRTSLLEAAYRKAITQRAAMEANAMVVSETITTLAIELGKMNEKTLDYARLQEREKVMLARIKELEDERYRLLDDLAAHRLNKVPATPPHQ